MLLCREEPPQAQGDTQPYGSVDMQEETHVQSVLQVHDQALMAVWEEVDHGGWI